MGHKGSFRSLRCIGPGRTRTQIPIINLYVIWTYFSKRRDVWPSWIRTSWYNYENNQQNALYGLIYDSKSALYVSGDVFAHHQEQLVVFIMCGSVHPSCCRLVSRMRHQPAATWVNTTRYCKYREMLPMMSENIARNTYSWLGIIN